MRRWLPAVAMALAALSGTAPGVRADTSPARVVGPAVASFVDDLGTLDRLELRLSPLPMPPSGTTYRVWLRSADHRQAQSAGELPAGQSTLFWSHPSAESLLQVYSTVLITLEESAEPGGEPGEVVVLQGEVDPGVLPQLRRLFVRWPESRFGIASLEGARRLAGIARIQVAGLKQAAAAGDLARAHRRAEHVVNLVEGQQGQFYGDHNRDGIVEDPGDGLGLLNYLSGAIIQTQYAWALAAADDTAGEALAVQPPLRFALEWTGFLRDLGLEAAAAGDAARILELSDHLARGAENVAAGIDAHEDAVLAAILAEWGLTSAYERAAQLARAPLTQPCQFVLGFATLESMMPETVGLCLEEQRSTTEGDAVQRTTGGLLVWRHDENWSRFTDGTYTWINGPDGLIQRSNDESFPWERGQ